MAKLLEGWESGTAAVFLFTWNCWYCELLYHKRCFSHNKVSMTSSSFFFAFLVICAVSLYCCFSSNHLCHYTVNFPSQLGTTASSRLKCLDCYRATSIEVEIPKSVEASSTCICSKAWDDEWHARTQQWDKSARFRPLVSTGLQICVPLAYWISSAVLTELYILNTTHRAVKPCCIASPQLFHHHNLLVI